MKKIYLFIFFFSFSYNFAQQLDSLYVIAYKNLPNTATSNTNGNIKVAKINPITGFVSNLGTGALNTSGGFSVAGGAVNQVNNNYYLLGRNMFRSFSLATGALVQQNPINNFAVNANSNTFQVRFCNSNTSLYGLTRVTGTSPLQGLTYLSKLDTDTGNLVQISQNSIGNLIPLNGAVIDPDQMIYYYSGTDNFVGLDLYNGSIYSNPNYIFSDPEYYSFANIAFNCSNNEIYGLIRGKTPGQNPLFPLNYIYYFKLGKINPTTGLVTEISTVNLPTQIYSLGALSSIDEANGIYYFADNSIIYGVSITTGLVVSTASISYQDGDSLFFLNNYNNCRNRTPLRQNPAMLDNQQFIKEDRILIIPNPVVSILKIETSLAIDKAEVIDANGRIIKTVLNPKEINVEDLALGVYILRIYQESTIENKKFIKTRF